tara:strand:+ start:740 stop:976 length:237 start_codon:yes stop_codon:yes gene_type:complete
MNCKESSCKHCLNISISKKKYNKSEKGKARKKEQNRKYYLKRKERIKNLTLEYNAILNKKSGEQISTIQQNEKGSGEN